MTGTRGRSKRSAKNRLKSGRVTVPAALASLTLPEGCLVQQKSLEVLTHGASSLEQLCALKEIVFALGVSREQREVGADTPGLRAVVGGLLRILPEPGSKPLHDELKNLMQAVPPATLGELVDDFILEMIEKRNPEMLLAIGALCNVPAARASLASHFEAVLLAACLVLDALGDAVSLSCSQSQGMQAQVDKIIALSGSGSKPDAPAGEEEEEAEDDRRLAEPEMLCFCMHGLMELVAGNGVLVDKMVSDAVANGPGSFSGPLKAVLECLHRLISNAAVHKDALTPACIILCGLVQRSSPHAHINALQLASLAAVPPAVATHAAPAVDGNAAALASERPLLTACGGAGCFSVDALALPPFAQQCLLRGVLSGASPEVRSTAISNPGGGGGGGGSLLFALVFDRVCFLCAATADLFLICYGLQTLAFSIDLAREAVRESLASLPPGASCPLASAAQLEHMCEAGMELLWPHCEDPFQGIVDQTKAMFESLADLRTLAHLLKRREAGEAGAVETGALAQALEIFQPLLGKALLVKHNRKARYRVLTALVPRVGVQALLDQEQGLVRSVLIAMSDQGVGTCAAALLEAMLGARATVEGDAWWIEPMLDVLAQQDTRVRHGLCCYAMPTIAKASPGGIARLLAAMQRAHAEGAGNLWGMTAVIKVARRSGQENAADGSGPVVPPLAMSAFLRAALQHSDSELRLNALEMLCVHAKQTESPTIQEMALVREFLSLNMKSSSSHYRQRTIELLRKFLMRLRISRHNIAMRARKAIRGTRDTKSVPFEAPASEVLALADGADAFLAWISGHLTAALFPGASFERHLTALELQVTVLDVWFPANARYPDSSLLTLKTSPEDDAAAVAVLFRAETASAVIDTMVNSFDNVRRQALEVLMRFPAPLPGIEDRAAVARLLAWAQGMVGSPRARESDSGALVIKVVHLKYVKELGWFISPCPSGRDEAEEAPLEGESPSLYFVRQLLVGIDRIIAAARVKFESTFGSSFAQGALLALRQVLPDLEIPPLLGGSSSAADERIRDLWTSVIHGVLERMRTLAAIAIRAMAGCPPERVGGSNGVRAVVVGGCAVSTGLFGSMYRRADQEGEMLNTPHSMQQDSLDQTQRNEAPTPSGVPPSSRHTHVETLFGQEAAAGAEEEGDEEKLARLGPKEQLLVVSCWLTLKEVGLTLGATMGAVPLDSERYLTRPQLIESGNLLLDIIFSTLHNGAIEKARLGFQRLCERLLRCPRAHIRFLPSEWLDRLLERLPAPDVPVVRRSSQLSFSILAILDAEVAGTARPLLARAMLTLIAAAERGVAGQGAGGELRSRVHALNILRHLFLDTTLAKEVAAFIPDALILTIKGFAADSWAVRNSSTLCFSVLLNRAMGGGTKRMSFTPGEFFLRYPTLCPGLLARLAVATANLEPGNGANAGQEEMHPELQPVLVLLSNLAPSQHVRDDLAHLAAFVPPVRQCLAHRNEMVRAMAARALVSFIPAASAPTAIDATLLGALRDPPPLTSPHAFRNNNLVHGFLEATRRLVRHQCGAPDLCADVAESLAARGDWHTLCLHLAARLPLWVHDKRIPPPTRLLLLKTCGGILWTPNGALQKLAPTRALEGGAAELRDAVVLSCDKLLAEEGEAGCHDDTACPMLEALLGQASRLLVRQLLADVAASPPDAPPQEKLARVIQEIAAPSYERRWMALRATKESVLGRCGVAALPAAPTSKARVALQRGLLARLCHEKHLGCLRKLLRCLLDLGGAMTEEELCVLVPGEGGGPVMQVEMWARCTALQRSTDPKVRERGLAFSGEVVRCLLASLLRGEPPSSSSSDAAAWKHLPAAVAAVLEEWIALVEEGMQETQHGEVREAAVDSLCRSRILTLRPGEVEGAGGCAEQVCRAWLAALVLLQDDDEDAREAMARAVSLAVVGPSRGGVQPAKAIEMVFEHLAEQQPSQPRWEAYLAAALRGAGDEAVVSDEVMARRLFEKEDDNFQMEELVVVMLAARLRRRAGAGSARGGEEAEQARAGVARLASYVASLSAAGQGASWAGGVSSRMDAFRECYRQLLAIWARGGGDVLGEGGKAQMLTIAQTVDALGAHHLLRHAVYHVAKDGGAPDAATAALRGVAIDAHSAQPALLFLLSSSV